MLLLWVLVFCVSLAVLVKGADWLIASAERIGLALGLSPFIIGITIVGVGTSFPELVSSLAAVWQGVPEVVAANAIGSNIANILLIVGISALVGKRLVVTKDLIDLDLPLLAISMVLVLGSVWDGVVTLGESVLLLLAYSVYLVYTVVHTEEAQGGDERQQRGQKPKLTGLDILRFCVGLAALIFGAKYLIDALTELSTLLQIGTGVIAITAVAIGTSLPELLVSVKAARQGKSEMALGNIFGSNIFNGLVVIGLPGIFSRLPIDGQTLTIGVPAMMLATILFVISGISRRVHVWEGALYLVLYLLFLGKLFAWL